MTKRLRYSLSKRERQMMEAIYRLRTATAVEVQRAIPDPPSYSAVRTTLEILVGKRLLAHRRAGRRYKYLPTIPHSEARRSALESLLDTYFDGSMPAAVTALVDAERARFSNADYRKLMSLIVKSEKENSYGTRPSAGAGERHGPRGFGEGARRVRRGARGGPAGPQADK